MIVSFIVVIWLIGQRTQTDADTEKKQKKERVGK